MEGFLEAKDMTTSTIDITETSRDLLRELAEKTGQTASEVIDMALDAYRRQVFFDKLNLGYAELRSDPQAWEEYQADQKEWEVTSLDSLDTDEQ
jgi:hypothetical protein